MTTPTLSIDTLVLSRGSHRSPDQGVCFMEAYTVVHKRPFSDHDDTVSPVIGSFLRSWNDNLGDDDRQKLKPYILKVVGTNTGASDEERRSWLATDWLARTCAPAWLERAGLSMRAQELRELPEINSTATAHNALATIRAGHAGARAWYANRAAAGDAWTASDAAWAASEAALEAARALGAAALAVNRAAWAARATRDAAWAAWEAAWAIRTAIASSVREMQTSAFDLLDRLIAVGKEENHE